MNKLAIASIICTLSLGAVPAHAQILGSGNSGLIGLGNNLLNLQMGHVSVLDGGILNGSNILSGNGRGASAAANHGSVVTGGRNNTVVTGSGNRTSTSHRSTSVRGNNNVTGIGNTVGNQWGSNFYSQSGVGNRWR